MKKKILPILLASDINAYSMARAFHEEYGIKSKILARGREGVIEHSKIVDIEVIEKLDEDECFLNTLYKIGKENPESIKILIGCADHYVRLISRYKESLKEYFVIPCPDKEVIEKMCLKEDFYKLCEEFNVDFPKTIVYKNGDTLDLKGFKYPIILKPSDNVDYFKNDFLNQEKVYTLNSEDELRTILEKIYDNGYGGKMIVQEKILGDDSQIYDIHVYVGKDKKVKFMSMGNVLLEEHTPKGVGSNAATLVDYDEKLMRKIRTLLEGIGYEGLADCDVKYDARDNTYKVFEINIRQGRSHYRVTGAGDNLAKFIVDDYIYDKKMEYRHATEDFFWHVVPMGVVKKYVTDVDKLNKIKKLYKEGKKCNSVYYSKDKALKRQIYLRLKDLNHFRKYKKYYKVDN